MIKGYSPERPGYWLHTGDTGILTYFDSDVWKVAGEPDDKVFNDWGKVEELVNLPAAAFHRNVDEIVLKTGTDHADRVKTAIVCPPTIAGDNVLPIFIRTMVLEKDKNPIWPIPPVLSKGDRGELRRLLLTILSMKALLAVAPTGFSSFLTVNGVEFWAANAKCLSQAITLSLAVQPSFQTRKTDIISIPSNCWVVLWMAINL